MTDSNPGAYLCLATQDAQKLGRNGGSISFKLLSDTNREQLFLTIVRNEGGGYFSREIAPFDSIERCLPADHSQPFGAKLFARAFQGKSANQPGFCSAVLHTLGLLGADEHKPHLHVVVGDWSAWKREMLSRDGEPYVPPASPEAVTGTSPEGPSPATTRDTPDEAEPSGDDPRRKGRKRPRKVLPDATHENPA